MKYVMEPMLFAFDQDLSERELTDYLEELLTLDDWWTLHKDEMYIQDSTSDVLYTNNYYPTGDSLKPLLEKHRIKFIQYGDVERIIVKMLNRSKCIEALYDEPLIEMKKQTLKKPLSVPKEVKRPKDLHNELLRLFEHVFLACEMGDCYEESFVVITKGVSEKVGVEYEYDEYIEDKGKIVAKEKKGASEVNCKSSMEDFLKDKDTPFLIWKAAERKDDLDLGVRVSVAQHNGKADLEGINADYNFTIQDSFYEDYCDGHYQCKDQDIRSAIQAVTEAVTEQNLRQVHAIRTGKKGNDPQMVREEYGAQRRNITTSIKLAYWKKGRVYKIANMREHDFFEPTWE